MHQPLFILCPLRSYSSVVCGMLGQHPDLYGVPELNLFLADTLGELMAFMTPRMPHGPDGLLRALAQLHDGAQDDDAIESARRWCEDNRSMTTAAVYEHLAELVAPRQIVDKSPAHVMRADFLERIIDACPEASFLHLTRHPRPTSKSILELLARSDEWGGVLGPRQVDPEKVWLRAHQTILDFTNTLPPGQAMAIRGEDLMADLDTYLPQIAEWLDIRDDAEAIDAMHHPEDSPYAFRGPPSAEFGNDPNFLDEPTLRKPSGQRKSMPGLTGPLDWAPDREFGNKTLKLAKQFGYR